jgi:hypothetical protein
LLKLAERDGARLLQASTSEVYGDPLVHPQPESYWGNVNCTGPRACYDEGKRAAEALCFDFERTGRAEVRVARIFNTYGPRLSAHDGRVVSNLVSQALAGEDITVFGDGSQTRSFCYVADLVDGLVKLMEREGVARRSGEPGQSHRADDLRTGRPGAGPDRILVPGQLSPPAGGRPQAAQARHLPRHRAAGLVADHFAGERAAQDHRLVRRPAPAGRARTRAWKTGSAPEGVAMAPRKIGVLTFHRCINYGSYWQARCLVEGLRAAGHDAVLLDHVSERVNRAEWRCALSPSCRRRPRAADRRLYRAKVDRFVEAFAGCRCPRRSTWTSRRAWTPATW